ncbi:hypothetical protein EMIHUDRAFT_221135 [Emiliania huxleyi CCMP1516]|uniref:Uncharacterized protein n=2 Tax=Emiliania huxleyi TaxID=2903 RepID=A0A0D3HZC0_EMIH1|nr:hypothetical protein EMIHUDRAFT_221135 [Emiliania huxleyi CCMP1516]EOD04355.1 hypothetical protein EMIHUDRAFT_221135 [Emiliania huxleyi CCMP1516]|eukprot:XP_005756784.1 hypothetical protein EMIHUDRAFT_221135 [Emiliania huxleyi CCMP1516]
MRERTARRGGEVPLPSGLRRRETTVQALCRGERRDCFQRQNKIAAGDYHSVFVSEEGRLMTCGTHSFRDNPQPILGHSELDDEDLQVIGGDSVLVVPRPVAGLADVRVRTVATGYAHTLAVSEAGAVYSFGLGQNGELGHGNEADQHTPRVIESLRGVRAVAASGGLEHSLVLSAAGEVYSFGAGDRGQIGHDPHSLFAPSRDWHQPQQEVTERLQLTPRVIDSLQGVRVVAVAAGAYHSLLLSEAQHVYSLGGGGATRRSSSRGRTSRFTGPQWTPQINEALRRVNVVAVSGGLFHSLVLSEQGHVYAFGNGSHGELGNGRDHNSTLYEFTSDGLQQINARIRAQQRALATTDAFGRHGYEGFRHSMTLADEAVPRFIESLGGVRVVGISAGGSMQTGGTGHSLVLSDEGEVYSFGCNGYGELGRNFDNESEELPTSVPHVVETLRGTRVVEIAAGGASSLAATDNGAAYGWGRSECTGLREQEWIL